MKSLILAGVLVISAQASANPMVSQSQVPQQVQNPVKQAAHCPDFSGNWKGACVTNGQPAQAAAVVIKQVGCEYLWIDGAFYAIGGSRAEAHKIPAADGTVQTYAASALDWNAGHTALGSITDIKVDKAGKGTTYADRLLGAAYLQNSKLISYANGSVTQTTCEFQ